MGSEKYSAPAHTPHPVFSKAVPSALLTSGIGVMNVIVTIIMCGNVFTAPTRETDTNFHWVLYTSYQLSVSMNHKSTTKSHKQA